MRMAGADCCSKKLDKATCRFSRCLMCRLCRSRFAKRLPAALPQVADEISIEDPNLLGKRKEVAQAQCEVCHDFRNSLVSTTASGVLAQL
jgi:hypothetical protein